MVKNFLMLPPFFSFNLSFPSGIATCTALRAIRRFRRQHCSRSSDSNKFTLLLHFQNFSSVFREIVKGKGLFHVAGKYKNLFERVTFPLLFQLQKVLNSFLQFAKGE
jgi:hypothetical protein